MTAIPDFDHTVKAEIKLIRHSVFERRVNEKFAGKIGCCDEDLEVIAGKIVSIEKAAYTIMPDEGGEVTVDLSLCSRAYKIGK